MSQRCVVCEKGPVSGNSVSHSNRHTRRRWLPNLQSVKAVIEGTVRRVRVCTQCLKSNRIKRAV